MTYELAKQLKDAGFPETQAQRDIEAYRRSIQLERNLCSLCGDGTMYLCPMCRSKQGFPTLSELIEACGDRFMMVQRYFDDYNKIQGWNAAGNTAKYTALNMEITNERGDTPEEAVANLWLKLHSKT